MIRRRKRLSRNCIMSEVRGIQEIKKFRSIKRKILKREEELVAKMRLGFTNEIKDQKIKQEYLIIFPSSYLLLILPLK